MNPERRQPVRIDQANACLWRGGHAVALTPKAFSVLRYLSEHPARLVTKQELLEAVWPGRYVTDAVLKVCIREIRKALNDRPHNPHFIETRHRRGYRLIADLSGAADAAPAPSMRDAAPRPDRLVGRDKTLTHLLSSLDWALAGQRQVVFISGEAGIGKTALAKAFVDQTLGKGELLVGRGQCIEQYSAGEAYFPWLQALNEICRGRIGETLIPLLGRYAPSWLAQMPWINDALNQEAVGQETLNPTRARMLREMAELLEAFTAETPLLLVLEDLHWSDHSTLDLVSMLARRRDVARLMLLITYRPVEVILADHPLKAVKQDLEVHGCCKELPLDYLDQSQVNAYLENRFPRHGFPPEFAAFIHRRTEGNPLFMVNVVDYLVARSAIVAGEEGFRLHGRIEDLEPGVPESLRQMIDRQVEGHSAEEQRVLEAASVAGQEFTTAALAAILELGETETETYLTRLTSRAQFIRDCGLDEWPDGTVSERYAFVHALYQNVLYQRQTAARRAQFHERIGKRLERAYGMRTGEIAAELALHFEQARDYHRVIAYLRQAASNATSRYIHREAEAYLTRALQLTGRLSPEHREDARMKIFEQRGQVRRLMADMQGAAEDFEALAAAAGERCQFDRQAMALVYGAIALSWVDRQRCLAAVAQLEDLANRLDDTLLRAHTRGWSAYWRLLWRGWRNADAHACAAAIRAARGAGDRSRLNLLLGRYSYFQCLRSRYRASVQTADEAARLALETGNAFEYLLAHFFSAWALLHAGEWGKMHAVLGDGIQMAEKNGQHLWALLFRLELAWLSIESFDFEAGRSLAEEGLQQARQYHLSYGELLAAVLLGQAHLGLAEYPLAFECFHGLRQRLARERVLMDWIVRLPLYQGLAEHWFRQGNPVRARRDASRLYALAARPGERSYQALGRRALAQVAIAQDRWTEAEAELSRALKLLEGRTCPLAQWRVYATAAECSQRQRRCVEADRYQAAAGAVLTRLADSLTGVDKLRQSLLNAAPVQDILRRV